MSGKKYSRADQNNNGAGENLPLISSLNLKDDKYTLTVTVRKASVGDGLKRGHLIGQSFEKSDSVDRAAAALHANCICCSEGEIKNLKTGKVVKAKALPEPLVKIVKSGGLLPLLRKNGYMA